MRILLRCLCLFSLAITAMEAYAQTYVGYQNYCTIGNQKVNTQGLLSSNSFLQTYPGCTVTVYTSGTPNKATIYSDALGTALTNPFTANTAAGFLFFAQSSAYPLDVVISGAGMPAPYTFTAVQSTGTIGPQGPPGATGPQGPPGQNAPPVVPGTTLLNVESSTFATGWTLGTTTQASCVGVNGNPTGYADPDNVYNSICAIRSAVNYSIAWGALYPGTGYTPVYFPHGQFLINVPGYPAAIQLDYYIPLVGDSPASSFIHNTSPLADAVFYSGLYGCNATPSDCTASVSNLRIIGNGHASIGGGLEILNAQNVYWTHSMIQNVGGVSFNLQGSAERNDSLDNVINQSNRAILTVGDTNENYFRRTTVVFPSVDFGGYCYSIINCPGGVPNPSGIWYPDPHAQVTLRGVNVQWEDSSIKGLQYMSGMNANGESVSISHTYFEGNPFQNGSPATNHALMIPGPAEIGHLTAAVTATATVLPIDDALWQPNYINDPAFATSAGVSQHAADNAYVLAPADAIYGSTAPSTAVPGVAKGYTESILVYAASADQNMHVNTRGTGGTAIAWPAGTLLIQRPFTGYGSIQVKNNHFNAVAPGSYNTSLFTESCDDTLRLPLSTQGTIYSDCYEIGVGSDPDNVTQPLPNAGGVVGAIVEFEGNSIYTGGTEAQGQGWIKVFGNGDVSFAPGDSEISTGYTSSALAAGTYQNENQHVQFVQWPGGGTNGRIQDAGSGVFYDAFNGAFGSFSGLFADPGNNGAIAAYKVGPYPLCNYGGSVSEPNPLIRFCTTPDNRFVIDAYNGTTWVNQVTTNQYGTTFTGPILNTGQAFPASGSVSAAVHNIFLNAPSTTSVAIEACTSTNNGQQYELYNQQQGSGQSYPPTLTSTSGFQVNGTETGVSMFSLVVPRGVHWTILCDNTTNGYYEWRVNTNGGAASMATVTLDGSQSGSVAASATMHELSGSFSLVLTTAATAGATLAKVNYGLADSSQPQGCSASVPTSPLTAQTFANQGYFLVYTPCALAAGTYTVTYLCVR